MRRFQLEVLAEVIEVARHRIDQLLQCAALDFQIVLRGDLLRAGQVVPRLRLKGVGDGGAAHLEVALGLFELFGDRVLLRLDQVHGVLRDQHVEIGLRDAHDQILFGDLELRIGLRGLQFGFAVGLPVLLAEQRLHQVHAVTIAVVAIRRRWRKGRYCSNDTGCLIRYMWCSR